MCIWSLLEERTGALTYHVGWEDAERTVYHLKLCGRWTWEEWSKAYKESYLTIEQTNHAVDLICSIEDNIPKGNAVPHLKFVATNQPANLRYTLLVNQVGAFFSELVNALNQQMGWRGLVVFEMLEDAYSFIDQNR
ncbi:MAG: hypothetical protein ACOYLB_10570 [Phototrophicaceae bacterium]